MTEVNVQEKSIFNILGEAYRDAESELSDWLEKNDHGRVGSYPDTLIALMKVPQGFNKREVLETAADEILGESLRYLSSDDDKLLAFIIDSAMEFIIQRMQQEHQRKAMVEQSLRQGQGGQGLIA